VGASDVTIVHNLRSSGSIHQPHFFGVSRSSAFDYETMLPSSEAYRLCPSASAHPLFTGQAKPQKERIQTEIESFRSTISLLQRRSKRNRWTIFSAAASWLSHLQFACCNCNQQTASRLHVEAGLWQWASGAVAEALTDVGDASPCWTDRCLA